MSGTQSIKLAMSAGVSLSSASGLNRKHVAVIDVISSFVSKPPKINTENEYTLSFLVSMYNLG